MRWALTQYPAAAIASPLVFSRRRRYCTLLRFRDGRDINGSGW